MKGFISYAHKDKYYFDLLVEGLNSHSVGSELMECKIWSDNAIEIGDDWHKVIQEKLDESEFAIVLLSANFFSSKYIQETEWVEFLRMKKREGFLIFPILLRDFKYERFKDVSQIQFFQAPGKKYGHPDYGEKTIPFDRLIVENGIGEVKPNFHLETYFKELVSSIESAIKRHNYFTLKKEGRISRDYNMLSEATELTPLQQAIKALDLRSAVLKDLHRVNCDRINLIPQFNRFFERSKKLDAQFYLILADRLHQPESFAERLIYEIEQKVTEKGYSIYYKPYPPHGIASKKIELTDTLKVIKRRFKTGFSEMASPEQDQIVNINSLEEFLTLDSPILQYDYVALVFHFNTAVYPEHLSLLEYLTWIRDKFCKIEHSKTKFLFFLVFPLVDERKNTKEEKFTKTLKRFAGKDRRDTFLIRKFGKVRLIDLVSWFEDHLVDKVEAYEIVQKIVKNLDTNYSKATASRFFDKEDETFQMTYVQEILNQFFKLKN